MRSFAQGFPARDIAIDPQGNVYVVEAFGGVVEKFTADGQLLRHWEGPGQGLDNPRGIAVDAHDHVYVTDTANNRIEKFTSRGRFLRSWGRRPHGHGRFRNPRGVAVDSQGNVYVTNAGSDRVKKFSQP